MLLQKLKIKAPWIKKNRKSSEIHLIDGSSNSIKIEESVIEVPVTGVTEVSQLVDLKNVENRKRKAEEEALA